MASRWLSWSGSALFTDRTEAGRRLADRLGHLAGEHPLVVALPRGGVPVAVEVARALRAPLDVLIVRKLGYPGQPELAMGAVGEDGVRVLNAEVLPRLGVADAAVREVTERETAEVARRVELLRGGRAALPVAGRTVIVVDDGLATGSTAEAAVRVLRARGAGRVVVAVPVAPPDTVHRLAHVADEVVAVETPEPFAAIGLWYGDFSQVDDHTVRRLLDQAAAAQQHSVSVAAAGVVLPGDLTLPPGAVGLVLFAHGSGSSRLSPRNRAVAQTLVDGGLATLLLDLLLPEEAASRAKVFDIPLLAQRLVGAAEWASKQPEVAGLPVGFFGASTGAAAALVGAADLGERVRAVVSRGGRPDLAGERLAGVSAPTLLIVGGADPVVLDLNEQARRALRCPVELTVVPHATHLFEEPGALERVADLARDWFLRHLPAG